jgi:hypothetical protein
MAIAYQVSPALELPGRPGRLREHASHPDSIGSRRLQFLAATVLFLSYAYFFSGFGWNQNTRFDLTRALVEQHTVRIDSFEDNTGDKSFRDGHYYCDKAPGLSLAAVPVWAAVRAVIRAAGRNPSSRPSVRKGLYASTLVTVALPTILALWLLCSIAIEMGASPSAAAFALLALGLGTPLWCYADLLWGHAAAGAFLVFAFAAARKLGKPGCPHSLWLGLLVGLAGGCATLVEYPAAPAAALLAGYALLNAREARLRQILRAAGGIFAGAMACVAVLCTYNRVAFGSALALSYKYNPDVTQLMQRGILGVTYPKPTILFQLLFNLSHGHGLLPLAPVLLGALPGVILIWKNNYKRDALMLLAVPAYYLLFNSAYLDWTGGYTYGPRYLGAGLFFLALPLAITWTASNRQTKFVLAALAMIGSVFALVSLSTNPLVHSEWHYPLKELARAFVSGKMPMDSFGQGSNAGIQFGLYGLRSLVPLVVLWLLALITAVYLRKNEQAGGVRPGRLKISRSPVSVEIN